MEPANESMKWVRRASEYQTLAGKRDHLGFPLATAEKARLAELESSFAPLDPARRITFEGREQARVPIALLVAFDQPGGEGSGYARDLSGLGMWVQTRLPLPVGARTIVRVDDEESGEGWRFTAEVVRVGAGDRSGMGLKFIGIPLQLRVGHRPLPGILARHAA